MNKYPILYDSESGFFPKENHPEAGGLTELMALDGNPILSVCA